MATKQQVKIYGKSYTVKETESDIPIDQISEYVDSKMRELAGSAPKMGTIDIAILAALNIAQELMECQNELKKNDELHQEINEEIDKKAGEMVRELSQELKS
jgi:cell division protein ZapA (FtsZ GTPase activity inhibitor)